MLRINCLATTTWTKLTDSMEVEIEEFNTKVSVPDSSSHSLLLKLSNEVKRLLNLPDVDCHFLCPDLVTKMEQFY